jgi:Protein of unknown function (DUF3105)
MAARRQARLDRQERIAAVQAGSRTRTRRARLACLSGGALVIAVLIGASIDAVGARASGPGEVLPPGVSGATTTEPPALAVPSTTGISGVVAYDTTGWPVDSHNGPAAQSLPRDHVAGPVKYSVTPPVGGDHNGTWMNCGVYDQPVPSERAVHNLEHGAVWITYSPSLPQSQVSQLRAFFARQAVLSPDGAGSSRYIDLTPFPGLPAPIVASAWGFQLRLTSASDPRLQQFVSELRVSQQFTPEFGGPCTGGVGTPLQS